MTHPAADDPLLRETRPPAALQYRPADAGRPPHSRLGVAALAAALVSPMAWVAFGVMVSVGGRTPPVAVDVLVAISFWGGPVVGLALGTAALLRGGPRRRRWPAVVAVTLSGLTVALLATILLFAPRG